MVLGVCISYHLHTIYMHTYRVTSLIGRSCLRIFVFASSSRASRHDVVRYTRNHTPSYCRPFTMRLSSLIHIVAYMGCMLSSSGFVLRTQRGAFHVVSPTSSMQEDRHRSSTIKKTFGGMLQLDHSMTHASLSRQRRSVASIQTHGIFGLGGLELAIILAAAAFLIGPQQLGKITGQFKTGLPDELKKIPEEFQKGVEEGETNARARNAKVMKPPPDDRE